MSNGVWQGMAQETAPGTAPGAGQGMAENAATARRRAWSARFAGAIGLGLAFAIASPASLAESGKPVAAQDRMVVAAHPLAAQTGLMILRAGGNAVDAAVAMQMVLTLVEPQSSGIGGGGFLLHYDAKTGALSFHDGRETAPARATADMFLDATGNPRPFGDVVAGGLSVGVPGAVEMLEALHREHGRLPWARLFDDAVRLSEQGFPVSPRLARMIASDEALRRSPTARRYFFDAQGRPWPAGATLRNPALAASFRLIAAGGSDAFYRGQLAHEIVRAVAASPVNPGRLSLADLARYQAREREAVCTDYRAWRVCSAPPPSSGGIAVLQVLELLERFDLARIDPGSAVATHLFAEANRLAFADRNFYVADPDFRKVPTLDLLDSGYLAGRSQSIPFGRAIWKVTPGVLPNQTGLAAPLPQAESDSTTHMSVVDRDGNAVSFTSTIEDRFGSRVMAGGFLLNNQLTDFSFQPERGGHLVANRVEAGKRPRSSMAPTMVFDGDGRLRFVLGSPGGGNIIPYVAKTLIGLLDWRLDPRAAIGLPNLAKPGEELQVEAGTALERQMLPLRAMGHSVESVSFASGLAVIAVAPDGTLAGAADPRREGVALGD